jgi:hypothetical protein
MLGDAAQSSIHRETEGLELQLGKRSTTRIQIVFGEELLQ